MTKNNPPRQKLGSTQKTRRRQSIGSAYVEDFGALVARLTRALARGLLIMILVATPSAILPGTGQDTQQMVALLAIFAGLLTLAEYNGTYPSLIEFRDAPPYNRIRFTALFLIVLSLSLITAAPLESTLLNRLAEALGLILSDVMDFPYSPVRILAETLPPTASSAEITQLRALAATGYILAWVALVVFIIIFKARRWPDSQHGFNVWTNLPTFEPTAGGDVVTRLERDSRINLALGISLPFLLPFLLGLLGSGLDSVVDVSPQTLIWMVTIWAFYPASLLMRGIAMSKIASMIRRRRAAHQNVQQQGEPAIA